MWPAFGDQIEARHCRRGKPVDTEPHADANSAMELEPMAWAGPIVRHFGHQVGDFSMRLYPTLLSWPAAVMAFGVHPQSAYRSIQDTPTHFREVLAWFGIPEARVRIVCEPTVAAELFVTPQAEQIYGPGPGPDYLDRLDDLVTRRLGKPIRQGAVYVSRAGMPARFAGERYLERALALAGARIIQPEKMSLLVQLRAYVSAERLIFAEGSALHGTQLLGRSLGDVTVLERRGGWHLGKTSVEPRAQSLHYADVTRGLIHGLRPEESQRPRPGCPS